MEADSNLMGSTKPEDVKPQPEKVETGLTEEEKAEFELFKKNKAHFQQVQTKQFNELNQQIAEERVKRSAIEKELSALKNPVNEVKPPVEPVEPTMPVGYSEIEALSEPNSVHGKYLQASRIYEKQLHKYNRDLIAYQQKVFEDKMNVLLKSDEENRKSKAMADIRNKKIAEFQGMGLTKEEAEEAFEYYSSPDSLESKNLVAMWQATKKKSDKPTFTQPPSPTSAGKIVTPDPSNYIKSRDTSWMYRLK